MSVSFQQTDTAAIDGTIAACSSFAVAGTPDNRQMTVGGTPGTTAHVVTFALSLPLRRFAHFETPVGLLDGGLIQAGTWTIRLNVTVASTLSASWGAVDICIVDVNGINKFTIGKVTGLNINLTSTGIKTATVSGVAYTPNTGDKVYIILSGNSADGGDNVTYQSDQLIDSQAITLVTCFTNNCCSFCCGCPCCKNCVQPVGQHNVPSVLTVTISNATGQCNPCLNGFSFKITKADANVNTPWQAINIRTPCGSLMTFVFNCINLNYGGEQCSGFAMISGSNNCAGGAMTTPSESSCNCNPLMVVFNNVQMGAQLQGCCANPQNQTESATFTVTV